ncbi:unnamed protein product [Phaedon cochleariae]|uniref:15-hydroxyprostaglandin dehydrogenase n=1 Tax=Phaedon cochleariae TaxID=80249 RepID=A0A9P0DDH0_PHACE|nr:unnamed protein product [Phaedon cochleariae]
MALIPQTRHLNPVSVKHLACAIPSTNAVNLKNQTCLKRCPKKPDSKILDALRCKVALVTGGSRGVGYQLAESLLDVGTKAVIFGDAKDDCKKDIHKLNEKYGEPRAFFLKCDLSRKSDMEKLFKTAMEKFKKIDLVINNADLDGEWEQTLCNNLHGIVRGTLLGFQHMGTQTGGKGGYIINVSSILGLQPFFASPIYSGTKHFGIGFSRSMGHEYFYTRSKVKVLTLCPSLTESTTKKKNSIPEFKNLLKDSVWNIRNTPSQEPGEIGKGLLTMLEDAENGSVWVSEGNEFYKATMPDRRCMKADGSKGDDGCGKENPCKIKVPKKKKDKCEPLKKHDPCHKDNPCRKPNNTCK